MNWKTFFALLARDAHVARRNFIPLLLQTFLQPMMFVFIFGRVMVSSGYMPAIYKSLLLPGIMAISMIFTGVWAVAMPLISEFQFNARDRRSTARADRELLARDRESFLRRRASDCGGTHGDTGCVVVVAARGIESHVSRDVHRHYDTGRVVVCVRRIGARLQHR